MVSQQRVALITGGSRGIGAATARLLAAQGNKVVINYLKNETAAQQVIREIGEAGGEARALQANVQDEQQVKQLVAATIEAYGRIDILVSNAPAGAVFKPFQQIAWEEFIQPVTSELKAAFELTKAVTPAMIQQSYGRIVYMSSGLAKHPTMPGSIGIGTAKASLVAFTRYIAQEMGPYSIIANTVAPGMVDTDLSRFTPDEQRQRLAAMTPLRRIAQAEDVARVIAYLVSEDNSFVTGTYTPVTGGLTMD